MVAHGRRLRAPQRGLDVGVPALPHGIGGAHDRGVTDEVGGADAFARRLLLDQGPEGVREADGGGSHRHG
jgi:hypothetical protein